MNEERPVIECRNVTHYYGKKLVYENLNIVVPEGHIMGLLGKNGAGKSTTINILNGFLEPRSGQCLIYGEDTQNLSPETKKRIGYLIEGHIQYSFMNVHQIEKFYSGFYENWKSDAYWSLINRLKITPKQKISTMSCGQRAQVALGLILAQDPDLLILDDFSLGLDPGYRRLFVDYLRDYARSENKTVFLTSHIIQDMERLVDDCIIMDYGRILIQQPVKELLDTIRRYTCTLPEGYKMPEDKDFYHPSLIRNTLETFSFLPQQEVETRFRALQMPYSDLKCETVNLEDAFIGLTGKY